MGTSRNGATDEDPLCVISDLLLDRKKKEKPVPDKLFPFDDNTEVDIGELPKIDGTSMYLWSAESG